MSVLPHAERQVTPAPSPKAPASPKGALETAKADAAGVAAPAASGKPAYRPNARMFSKVDEMPAAGVIAKRELIGSHSADTPLLMFAARQLPPPPAAEVVHTAFAKAIASTGNRNLAAARQPHPRPTVTEQALAGQSAPPPLLAYARAPSTIDEPFRVVLGELRTATDDADDGIYRPRPRPGDEVLAAWLDGRSPAQFLPGQHSWLQNPLPASVYSQDEQKCLAEGIYFEARGEAEAGQTAVAQVILNRVRNPAYPNTICGVVYQNEKQRHKCQFSFACDGRAEIIRSQKAWKVAQRIALDVTDGKVWIAEVGDSTHYHANYVSPRWGRRMIKVDKIGAHIFYRTRFGGWS
jgi:hypothetical protein